MNFGCPRNPRPRADDRSHSSGRLRLLLDNFSFSSNRLSPSFADSLLKLFGEGKTRVFVVDCVLIGRTVFFDCVFDNPDQRQDFGGWDDVGRFLNGRFENGNGAIIYSYTIFIKNFPIFLEIFAQKIQ